MKSVISEIRLKNFKRFRDYILIPNNRMNLLVGDNDVGKSTILEAISLVANGNIKRFAAIGIDMLFNIDAIKEFNQGKRRFEKLPKMHVELFLNGDFDWTMNGKNNSSGKECDGIKMVCEPNQDYQMEITDALKEHKDYFPFEYYFVRFSTFADQGYSGYKKKIRSVLIDSTSMNSDYATNNFIKNMYMKYTESNVIERTTHRKEYRQMKIRYGCKNFSDINGKLPKDNNYAFGLKSSSTLGLEDDLMIYEDEISIGNKGKGRQVFIKTDFALGNSQENVDVVLMEEPENHLSPINLRKLIQIVSQSNSGQIFITTHNSLISTRLELNNLLIMHNNSENTPTYLKQLTKETANYFMKAPPVNIVEFSLSRKVLLVEGPSEYILFEKFYESVNKTKPEEDNVQILDVRGLSFKRYLEIATFAKMKVAVVTDNDGDGQKNCVDKYKEYDHINNIKIFFEQDDEKRTFENLVYESNKKLCDEIFSDKTDAFKYMIGNKTEAAYSLLLSEENLLVPTYIQEAVIWIKE